jgi:hypothetical protein
MGRTTPTNAQERFLNKQFAVWSFANELKWGPQRGRAKAHLATTSSNVRSGQGGGVSDAAHNIVNVNNLSANPQTHADILII